MVGRVMENPCEALRVRYRGRSSRSSRGADLIRRRRRWQHAAQAARRAPQVFRAEVRISGTRLGRAECNSLTPQLDLAVQLSPKKRRTSSCGNRSGVRVET